MTSSPNREISTELVGALHRSSGSYELVVGAVIAALVGFGLDTIIGIRPVLTIAFAAAGLAGAVISIVFHYRAQMVEADQARTKRRSGGRAS